VSSGATPDSDRYDLIVVGSGIAGLYAALQAIDRGASVLLVTKGAIDEATTRHAQGGIAAAVGPGDSTENHLRDTIEAGAGLVDEAAARILCEEAADRVADLVHYGVRFDDAGGEVALGHEGAHSQPRILHARGDATGLEIELSLTALAREGATILEHTFARRMLVDDDRAVGVEIVANAGATPVVREVRSDRIVLATGGAGRMYRVTTNPRVSTGDGIALAYACGAEVMDMEFTQFHPTALRIPGEAVFLISEAVRGEGAHLLNEAGERFMKRYDERGDLAPRDIVARASLREMQLADTSNVWLDITERSQSWLAARFPQITQRCLDHGIDISRERIPVSPAAHYLMGGVRTNTCGETTVPGLYAVGEVACTGVHGANRLASNSLLETVVFAKRTVQRMFDLDDAAPPPALTSGALSLLPTGAPTGESAHADLTLAEVQSLMWDEVGIVRHGAGLRRAAVQLARWQGAPDDAITRDAFELRATLTCARLASEAALRREESRGAHYRTDFPESDEAWRRHLVFRQTQVEELAGDLEQSIALAGDTTSEDATRADAASERTRGVA
jgi:L-aspartate oxidase